MVFLSIKPRAAFAFASLIFGLAVLLNTGGVWAANPSNGLRVEVIAAPNFVVDSNVETPASYGPRAAYLGATFYNDGTNDITGVYAYIGDFKGGTGSTPGLYPSTNWPGLTGSLFFTHEGGSSGLLDATRYLGTIKAGTSVTVYWLVSYPVKDSTGKAVFGSGPDPSDDPVLTYDIWVSGTRASTGVTANQRKTATLRNEISAMANKIFPNTANKVPTEFQVMLDKYAPQWDTAKADGSPGTSVSMEGVWYDLGVVNGGYDINGDLVPDNDLWMQPVGDPSLFDASCLRLVQVNTLVVVKLKTGGELVYTDVDKLYYTDLPPNNGVIGYVRYDFLPLTGPCSLQLTPYQEAASGKNNEKFNADYGSAGVPPVVTTTSSVTMAKSSSMPIITPGQTNLYSIAYTNNGSQVLGEPLAGMPLVVQDHIPTGMTYVAGSAASSNVLPVGVTAYTILYSTNNGTSWTNSEPVAATNVTDLQWWLSDVLATGATGVVRFKARVQSPYVLDSPAIINTGKLSFGSSAPFLESVAQSLVTGTNWLGDTVFVDNGEGGGVFGNRFQDGTEPGLSNILVYLYWDANTNSIQDAGDVFLTSAFTGTNGIYRFDSLLPDARYVVVVNTISNVPSGYTVTTPSYYGVDLDSPHAFTRTVAYSNADFGFVAPLQVTKTLTSTNNLVEGRLVTYSLSVTNTLPGNGTGVGSNHVYTTWAQSMSQSSSSGWNNPSNALYAPDLQYASNRVATVGDTLHTGNFWPGLQPGTNLNVKIEIPLLVEINNLKADTMIVDLYRGSPGVILGSVTNYITNMVSGTLLMDITSWTNNWGFLTDTNVDIAISTKKVGGTGGSVIQIDAVGLRITTDQMDGSSLPSTTLDPVPVWDSFNSSFLQYVSATVPPTTVTTNTGTFPNGIGALYWDNLGPLYPGGGRQISVTFKALEPFNGTSNTAMVVTNSCIVTNAAFLNGASAGSFIKQATNTLNPAGSIGDYVYRDVSPFGAASGGDVGIANVKVVLTAPVGVDVGNGFNVITNTTDANGYYLFEGLTVATNYTVTVLTNTLPGSGGMNTYDEDGNTNNSMVVTNLIPTSTNGLDKHWTTDFGYSLATTIDGSIWWDINLSSNAVRNAGEPWLTNVTVRLYTNATQFVTTVTDTNGYFSFSGSYAGAYTVVVITNTGMMTNGTWGETWDTDLGSASTVTVSVVNGGTANASFSYSRAGTLSIGDMVFYDWNGNGSQGTNEEGIAYVPVNLYYDANSNGAVNVGVDPLVGTATTSSNGYYLFSGLSTGNYIVVVDQANSNFPNLVICTADPVPPTNGISYLYLTSVNTNQDFGFQPFGVGVIGDTVWRDLNGDGAKAGALETGISNVLVTLYVDANGDGFYVPLASTNTDSTGQYRFSGLTDARYKVVVDSTSSNIPKDTMNVRYGATTATSYNVTITGGNTVLTADFGFAPLGAIGDTIFWDLNGNGMQDSFESGVTGAVVYLYGDTNADGSGDVLLTNKVTSTNGLYLFTGLSTGRYVVVVYTNGVLTNAVLTADPEADGEPVSTLTNATAHDAQTSVLINYGTFFMGADFGFQPPGLIGDTVWIDNNNNGLFDTNEVPIPNVPVVIYSNNFTTALMTNLTDSGGLYGFGSLRDGTYEVRVLTSSSNFPSGLVASYDPDGGTNSQVSSIIISNSHIVSVGGSTVSNYDLNIDFGYRYVGTNVVSGTVGLDASPYDGKLGTTGNGVSSNEAPFAGVAVYAYMWKDANSNNVIDALETVLLASTTTSNNGDYIFTGLASSLGGGTNYYVVSLAAPQENLKLTTTNGLPPALRVNETTNLVGDTLSAYQVLALAAVTTNVDFAFKSTLAYDFGDLPSSYGTLLTDVPDGARHVVKTNADLYLGANVSIDANGQPSVNANLDTYDDGVTNIGVWVVATNGATFRVQVGKGAGWLVGFVDYGQKGTFLGSNDMIISTAVSTNGGAASNGVYTFAVNVPTNGISASTTTVLYARFRLFPSEPFMPDFAYAGPADDGEVEDYVWKLGSIGNTVWLDSNLDHTKNAGETGLTNALVFVDLNGDGVRNSGEPFAYTDVNGNYGIGGLPAGTYTTRVDTATIPVSYQALFDADGTPDNKTVLTLATDGEVKTNINFAYYVPVTGFSVFKTMLSPTNRPGLFGDQQTFRLTVTNTGNIALGTVPVTDVFDTNLVSFVSASPVPSLTNATSLVWSNVGPLAAWSSASVTCQFAVIKNGVGTNLMWSAPTTNGVPLPAATNSVVYTNIAPALTLGKTANPRIILAGQTVTYTYAVTNAGDTTLTNVVVTDDKLGTIGTVVLLPAGVVTNLSVATNITADVTNVAMVVGVPAYTNGTPIPGVSPLTNTANADVDVVAPGYTLSKVLVAPVNRTPVLGDVITFQVTVVNTGDVTLVQVPVTDSFDPYQLTYVSAAIPPSQVGFGTLVWTNLGPLAVGASTNVSVNFDAAGTVGLNLGTNTVVATPSTPPGYPPVPPSTNRAPYTIDAPGAIGDRVWLDENADGIQDAGEAGIANVQVILLSTNGTALVTNVTDSAGQYLFRGIAPGAYVIRVATNSMPAGLALNQTFDPDSVTNNQTTVTLAAGQEIVTADFGYNWAPASSVKGNTGTGAIGDRVWIDADGDGRQDPGEPGLGGVTVRLINLGVDGIAGTSDDTTNTTTTAADGSYVFDELSAGAYIVTVTAGTTGYIQTGDPDSVLDGRTTQPIVLAPGDVYVNADFGYQPQEGNGATIGDLVWFDLNGNGATNVNEYGIAGVSVALIRDSNANGVWDAGEPIIATTMTDANGAYLFTGVPVADGAGTDDYLVWVNDTDSVLLHMTPSYDSDGTGSPNISSVLNLTSAGSLLQDFGYKPAGQTDGTGAIGDTIFLDRNTNGVYDVGEGMEGVTVGLYNTNGVMLSTMMTDENGHYYFAQLSTNDATYVVKVSTNTLPGTLVNTVIPTNGSMNQSTNIVLTGSSAFDLAQDFGYACLVTPNSIIGTIWEDRNSSGVLDAGETNRYGSVTVALYDTNGFVIATTVTDSNGNYAFYGLPNGTFTVDVTDTARILEGTWHSLGAVGVNDNSQTDPYTVVLSGGQTADADFGYYKDGAALGNRVWFDANKDGVQDPGETGLNNVRVILRIAYSNGTTNVVSMLTDTNGYYGFANLLLDENFDGIGSGEPGYTLSVVMPGAKVGLTLVGATNQWLDSNSNGTVAVASKGFTSVGLLANPANESTNATYDFGLVWNQTLARLIGFKAFTRDGAVVVSWETSEELDTAGFYLERLSGDQYRTVHEELIPSYEMGGGVYEQVDPSAQAGGSYTYRLVELETSGNRLYLGPYVVTVDGLALSFDEWSRSVFAAKDLFDLAVSGAEADPDGDGMNNLSEFRAGTDPTNKDSSLRIRALDRASASEFSVKWLSESNRVYSVERAVNLQDGFQPLTNGIRATPPENRILDTVQPDSDTHFYRIRIE